MEQRIDPNTQPGYAAGTDPAFIPGLTAPVTAGKPDTSLEQTDLEQTETEQTEPEGTEERASEAAEAVSESDSESDSEEASAADRKEAVDGPAFEVSDRRGSITADREGVRFRLDDQEAEFRWDEIGAVEVKTPRFGRRFTVTVHVSTRRWFNAEVEAPARSSLKEWAAELDAVLDVYFEES
ncbi:hypothetical protein [Streptomyces sp. NBC_01363]|uniref:hypothetical protein n=1 Tax=Streptomyces sp. NBC_01363 TaxID=2903840 RepID=UPI00224E8623|nr:hypothetical protein [Streptomyces sp. NBC_01363]MCX4735413.1 hypothetical protein [Streptomyces sp. NBC_01363]